jgi:pimeloyl-ACP methyl ester carboxylesterase
MSEASVSCQRFFGVIRAASLVILAGVLSPGCTHAAPDPLLKRETARGEIRYSLHAPAGPAGQRVILAHGFLRSPRTMAHLAAALAEDGVETACIALRHSKPWAGNHAENARDMIALRQSLGWDRVAYAGFSAGGLSALVAAAEDPACTRLLLLDPVDSGALGKASAPDVRIPALAILGQPGPGNANGNAAAMLAAIPGCRIIKIPEASHCDFEARPSALAHWVTGARADAARGAGVHRQMLEISRPFLAKPEG